MIRRVTPFVALVSLVLALAGTAPALAANTQISGRLQTLDLAARRVSLKTETGQVVSLDVAPAAKINRNGTLQGLDRLVLGDAVRATFNPAYGRASLLTASGPTSAIVRGRVMVVASRAGTIAVGTGGGRLLVQTAAGTRFSRNGRVASLGDLTRLDRGAIALVPGTNSVAAVSVNGPEDDEVEGTITGISGNQITIETEQGVAVVVQVVAGITLVEVAGAPSPFTALTVGQEVEVHYDPNTFDAFRIQVEDSDDDDNEEGLDEIEGVVQSVGAGAITIARRNGEVVTLEVDAATEIEIDDQSAALADIPVGAEVDAKFDPETLLATEIEVDTEEEDNDDNEDESEGEDDNDEGLDEIEGVVKTVGAASITIIRRNGEVVTLEVDAATEIEIDDQSAALADIPVGAEVEAKFDPATLLATEIEVDSEEEDD